MDISAVSEPILIKQRWFCRSNCMFFQIWHSVFHYLTNKLFCVALSATELNYPFNQSLNRQPYILNLAKERYTRQENQTPFSFSNAVLKQDLYHNHILTDLVSRTVSSHDTLTYF